jgi:alpha-galactosidase
MKLILVVLSTLLAVPLMVASPAMAQSKPLRVFILAGQSNMEGHAKVETFDYIGDDPATAPLLKRMRGADGKPTVGDHVWISSSNGSYNYLCCAKTFALMGKAFAEATLPMMKEPKR